MILEVAVGCAALANGKPAEADAQAVVHDAAVRLFEYRACQPARGVIMASSNTISIKYQSFNKLIFRNDTGGGMHEMQQAAYFNQRYARKGRAGQAAMNPRLEEAVDVFTTTKCGWMHARIGSLYGGVP